MVTDAIIEVIKVASEDNIADLMVTYKNPSNFIKLARILRGLDEFVDSLLEKPKKVVRFAK